jgi:hypothetical protein
MPYENAIPTRPVSKTVIQELIDKAAVDELIAILAVVKEWEINQQETRDWYVQREADKWHEQLTLNPALAPLARRFLFKNAEYFAIRGGFR